MSTVTYSNKKTQQPFFGDEFLLLGNLVEEFNGKTTVRGILSEEKFEPTDQINGNILRIDASVVSTGVLTPIPNGDFLCP